MTKTESHLSRKPRIEVVNLTLAILALVLAEIAGTFGRALALIRKAAQALSPVMISLAAHQTTGIIWFSPDAFTFSLTVEARPLFVIMLSTKVKTPISLLNGDLSSSSNR